MERLHLKPNLKPASVRKHVHSEQEYKITDKGRDRERTRLSFPEIVSELAHKLCPKPIHSATKNQSYSEWIYQACINGVEFKWINTMTYKYSDTKVTL